MPATNSESCIDKNFSILMTNSRSGSFKDRGLGQFCDRLPFRLELDYLVFSVFS